MRHALHNNYANSVIKMLLSNSTMNSTLVFSNRGGGRLYSQLSRDELQGRTQLDFTSTLLIITVEFNTLSDYM